MANEQQLDNAYMEMAISMSKLSKGVRLKVGAIAVTKNGVIITGVNGLPKVFGNVLEDTIDGKLVTKPDVIHAENNILVKAAREGVSMIDSVVYITTAPCRHCSSMLIACGVKRVVYLDEYRDIKGVHNLIYAGIKIKKLVML